MPVEIVATILLSIIVGLANNGGIGGGGLIIPVCITMMGFSSIEAIALSNSIIFAGAVVRFLGFSMWQRNPKLPCQTIIRYNVVSVMIPLVLIGSLSGSLISIILPEAVLTIILVVLLAYLFVDSLLKGVRLWKSETVAKQQSKKVLERNGPSTATNSVAAAAPD